MCVSERWTLLGTVTCGLLLRVPCTETALAAAVFLRELGEPWESSLATCCWFESSKEMTDLSLSLFLSSFLSSLFILVRVHFTTDLTLLQCCERLCQRLVLYAKNQGSEEILYWWPCLLKLTLR